MLFFQGNSESANFQCKAQTLKWQLPKECSRADLFPCRNDKFRRVSLGTCCVCGTSDDLIAVCYSQAGESSWELVSEWWFPFRRNCLWGRLCKKMPLLSVRLSGNSYCGKVQDESVLHHGKTHLIPLKLLLVTIVSFIITCYFNRRDIYTSSVLLWYHSKHPRALGKSFIGFSGIKICLSFFLRWEGTSNCGFICPKVLGALTETQGMCKCSLVKITLTWLEGHLGRNFNILQKWLCKRSSNCVFNPGFQ